MNNYELNDGLTFTTLATTRLYYGNFNLKGILDALPKRKSFDTTYRIRGHIAFTPNVEHILNMSKYIQEHAGDGVLYCSAGTNTIYFSGTLSNIEQLFEEIKIATRQYCTEDEYKIFYVIQYSDSTGAWRKLITNIPKIYNNYSSFIHVEVEDFKTKKRKRDAI